MITGDQIENMFTYHKPTQEQAERYILIRDQAKALATLIVSITPTSREQSLAITYLQVSVMLANAAIALNEPPAQ
jgi:hypothetical protein